jgi:isochorismate hydrolase
VAKVEETGRDHLIIAGMSFEVCASLPALSAREEGLHPVVALDACGTFSHHKREAGLAPLETLGIEVSDYGTMMVEIMATADTKANAVYQALDVPFATLMGQVAFALADN